MKPLNSFYYLGIMIVFAVTLSIILIILSFLLAKSAPDREKLSPYECGFEPFSDSRHKFDIRYYLVSLLFILFDLEVAYLLPLPYMDLYDIKLYGLSVLYIFIIILEIGIGYEYSKGSLEKL